MGNICGWAMESGQCLCVENREWTIYVGGKWRVDNMCVENREGTMYVGGHREWTIYVGGKYRVDNICGWA